MSPDKLPFLGHKHILLKLKTEEGTRSLTLSALPFLKEHLSETYTPDLKPYVTIDREMPSVEYVMDVIRASQDRMHTLKDVYRAAPYFFTEPNYYVPALIDFRCSYSPTDFGDLPKQTSADLVQRAYYRKRYKRLMESVNGSSRIYQSP